MNSYTLLAVTGIHPENLQTKRECIDGLWQLLNLLEDHFGRVQLKEEEALLLNAVVNKAQAIMRRYDELPAG